MTRGTPERQAKAKLTREVFARARIVTDEIDTLLEKFTLCKVLRICAWISRFVYNAHRPKEERTTGPITTEEIKQQKHFWTVRTQRSRKRS